MYTEVDHSDAARAQPNAFRGATLGFVASWDDYGGYIREVHFDLLRSSGVTGVKFMINKWAWDSNVQVKSPDGSTRTYRQWIQTCYGWAKQRGLWVILEMYDGTENDANWEAKWQTKADFIMGKNPYGITKQSWINTCRDVALTIKPDGFSPFNEPPGGGDYHMSVTYKQAELFPVYRNFMIDCINAIHSVSPSTICYVESAPFWDISKIADQPLNTPNTEYEFHFYPCWNWDEEWTKVKDWVTYAMNKGLKAYCGECGTNTACKDWQNRMQEFYSWCKLMNISWVQVGLCGNSATTDSNYFGLLSNFWKYRQEPQLNVVGQLWQQNLVM